MNKEWILRRRPGGSWYVSQSEKTKETEVRLVLKADFDKAISALEKIAADFGSDNCDGNCMLAKQTLEELGIK